MIGAALTVTKPIEFAQAGIPHYWVFDVEERVSVTGYHSGDGDRYQRGRTSIGALAVTEPFSLSLDLTELLSPREGGWTSDRHQ